MAVRSVAESYELVAIQGWWPDSRRVTNVDEQEPQTLRPQQAALPERFDRRRMEESCVSELARSLRWRELRSSLRCSNSGENEVEANSSPMASISRKRPFR